MAFLPLLVGPVASLLDTVLKRVLPGVKMDEADKVKLAQELQLETMKLDWSGVEKEFQDRSDARALAQKDVEHGNAFTAVLAATVRPVWGYASLVVVAYPYLAGALGLPGVVIDDNTRSVVQTVIMFYFGGRTIEKVLPALRGK